jgi:hypothetical protein
LENLWDLSFNFFQNVSRRLSIGLQDLLKNEMKWLVQDFFT